MKTWQIIAGVVAVIAIIGFFALPSMIDNIMQQGPREEGPSCSAPKTEWIPERGDCPGSTEEMRTKCDSFCAKYPDCCGERPAGGNFGGRGEVLPLPSEAEVANLKRNYPDTIKALNEGPIYPRGEKPVVMNDEMLEELKSIGFNTIQVLLIGNKVNGEFVFNEANNALLINDIVAIKKHGMAVWIALDMAGGAPGTVNVLGDYDEFKPAFLKFAKDSAELMERYKVEYFTAANEPDKTFKEQIAWNAQEINANLADFFPSVNAASHEKFNGKLINKITQTDKHAKEVIDASFKNIDIAGVDVGPPMDGKINLYYYTKEFDEYQSFAALAQKAGLPWMNAEYWQGDFDNGYSDFAKSNELEYAKVSFDAYQKTTPEGVGYVWNDLDTFSLPQGEATKQALKEFFSKI